MNGRPETIPSVLAAATGAAGGVPATADSAPLSLTQEQLWFLDRLDPGNPAYNSTAIWRLAGQVDVVALTASLRQIVARQQMLRVCFAEAEGTPYQQAAPEVPLPFTMTDLSALPTDQRARQAEQTIAATVHRGIDLLRPPPFRVQLVRLGAEEHVLMVVIHHIVSDGWSVQVLLQELADLYAGRLSGVPVALPPLRAQYFDYARRQRALLRDARGEALLRYWTQRLADAPPALALPTDHPRRAAASFHGDRLFFQVPASLYEDLRRLSRAAGASLFMACLAGFNVLLARWSGQHDILVGTPVGNRDRPEWHNLVGYFADTLVIRTELGGDPTFHELLARVRTATLEALVHRDLPFRAVVEALRPARAANRNPLFQVMFILQNIPPRRRQVEFPGLELTPMDDVRATSIFDLRLDLFERPGGLRGQLEYNTDLFERATAERMATQYLALLTDACAHPERRIAALSMAPAADLRHLADGFNDDLGNDDLDGAC